MGLQLLAVDAKYRSISLMRQMNRNTCPVTSAAALTTTGRQVKSSRLSSRILGNVVFNITFERESERKLNILVVQIFSTNTNGGRLN